MILNQTITERIPKKQLSTLLKVSSALASSLDLPFVLQTAVDSTVEVLDLETGAVYLLEADELFLGATTPALDPELQWLLLHPAQLKEHPHIERAFRLRQPVFIKDATIAELTQAEKAVRDVRHLKSIFIIPLLSEEKAIGALIVGTNTAVRALSADELDLCRVLSYHIALAVTNARLYKSVHKANEELFDAYDATLLGWSLALEMRDQDTKGHTLRVLKNCEVLACEMGIPESDCINIRRGALLHDIGKMSVPDSILRKPGPLTEEEWLIMRKHCEYAYQFLIHIDYLLPALDIPYCHHEKWDGSGYPRGLKGEEIPLFARLFAVADVFDALTSDRPYRKAWKKEDALWYIREQSGRYFDPKIVALFLKKENYDF
jgi:HD-GYP domain-containing protein (c-di-GMP phosphodiesterase class II)